MIALSFGLTSKSPNSINNNKTNQNQLTFITINEKPMKNQSKSGRLALCCLGSFCNDVIYTYMQFSFLLCGIETPTAYVWQHISEFNPAALRGFKC